jgi:DNA repair protein RadC
MGIMDVRVLDHIIISKNGYFSFLEEGVLWKYLT